LWGESLSNFPSYLGNRSKRKKRGPKGKALGAPRGTGAKAKKKSDGKTKKNQKTQNNY